MTDLHLLIDFLEQTGIPFKASGDADSRFTIQISEFGVRSDIEWNGYSGFSYNFVFNQKKLIATGASE